MKKSISGSLLTTLLAAIIIAVSLVADGGGYSHPESNAFLQIYTDNTRPLLNILFDPQLTDWNHYQARELSYFFDWLDANFILFCCSRGIAHFYSIVTIILLLGTVFLQQLGIRQLMPHVPAPAAALLSLFYVLAPANSNLLFFRSSKPLCAFLLTVLFFSVLAIFLRRDENDSTALKVPWTGFCIAVLLLPYCDRQGAFSTAVCAMAGGGVLLLSATAPSQKIFHISPAAANRTAKAALIALAGVILSCIYNLFAAPYIIRQLNGYSPSFEYQNIGGGGIWNFAGGCWFLLANIGHSATGVYAWTALMAGVLLLAVWFFFCYRIAQTGSSRSILMLLLAGIAGAMLASANLMTFRHSLMLRDDVIFGGYFLPMLSVLILLLPLTFETAFTAGFKKSGKWITVLAAVMTAAAVLRTILPAPAVHDHLAFYKNTAPYLRSALGDPQVNYNQVTLPYSSLKLVEHFRRRNNQLNINNSSAGK